MSSIAVTASATGTGVVTLVAPVTNTNQTITFPDATGTLQVSGAPISGTTGTFSGLIAANGGIQFPATAVPSANANTLDDYEEGTWTPNVINTGQTSTWAQKLGNYVKVGGMVTCWFVCDAGNSGTAGSGLQIQGLPFTPITLATNVTAGIWAANSVTPNTGNVFYASGAMYFYTAGTPINAQATYTSGYFCYIAA